MIFLIMSEREEARKQRGSCKTLDLGKPQDPLRVCSPDPNKRHKTNTYTACFLHVSVHHVDIVVHWIYVCLNVCVIQWYACIYLEMVSHRTGMLRLAAKTRSWRENELFRRRAEGLYFSTLLGSSLKPL